MAKHSTHSNELDRLFRAARRDIPSAREQLHIEASVLAALRSGQVPPADLLDPPFGSPSAVGKFALKVLISLGVVALVMVGVTRLRHVAVAPSNPGTGDALHAPLKIANPATDVARLAPNVEETPLPGAASARPRETQPLATSTHVPERKSSRAATANKNITSSVTKEPPPKTLPTEASLVEQAHRELATNPSGALALTQTHRKLYPNGILTQEREVIAIEALARLGKSEAAKQRANGFRNEQPHSIHEPRLHGVLHDAGVEPRQ